MNTMKEPPKPSVILATPLNVEESRAQRQQRSQARFRDRGGIFVPSNRNLLADILLGKASPLKKPRRSVSASPSCKSSGKPASGSLTKSMYKDLVAQGEVSDAAARRSPRKLGRKPGHDATEIELSTIEQKTRPVKRSTAQEDPSNSKAFVKSNSTQLLTSSKTSVARNKLYDIPEGEEEVVGDTATSKSKSRASKAAIARTKSVTIPPPSTSLQPIDTTSTSTTTRPRPRKSQSDPYSGASEDEYIPPVKKTGPRKPRAKQADKPTKKPALSSKQKADTQLAQIPEEDEEEDGSFKAQKKSKTASGKRKKSTKAVLHEEQATFVKDPPRKKPGPAKRTKATKDKASKPETAAKTSIPAKENNDAVEEDSPAPARSTQTVKKSALGKGKKRIAQEQEPSGDVSPPPHKRVKRSDQEDAKKANAEKNTKKKRPREVDAQEEAEAFEKGSKRKKLSHKAKDTNSKTEAQGKKVTKVTKSKTDSKAVAAGKARKPTSTAKRKENSVPLEEIQTKPGENRRPPKSVLLRIMNSNSLPLVADNEPDEIDFLS